MYLKTESMKGQVSVLKESGPLESLLTQTCRTLDLANACWSGPRQACLTSAPWGSRGPTFISPASETQPSFLTENLPSHARGWLKNRYVTHCWAMSYDKRAFWKFPWTTRRFLFFLWNGLVSWYAARAIFPPAWWSQHWGWWSREETFISFTGSWINPLRQDRTPCHVRDWISWLSQPAWDRMSVAGVQAKWCEKAQSVLIFWEAKC